MYDEALALLQMCVCLRSAMPASALRSHLERVGCFREREREMRERDKKKLGPYLNSSMSTSKQTFRHLNIDKT